MTRLRRLVALCTVAVAVAIGGASTASAGVLDVTLAGSGAGTVTSNPAGISCSNVVGLPQTACSHDYGFFFGTGTLTATPAEGSAFLAWSGTVGGTCTGATNPCTTNFLFLDLSAVATFAPKPDPPAVATGTSSDEVFPSATVTGTVNPNSDDFSVTDCHFEYGLTTEYGAKAACTPGTIAPGNTAVSVSASIGVLEAGETYHYRLVATNGGGTSRGEDKTLISGLAPEDNCPNSAIRTAQGALAQRLPNCGAYELVSPRFTAGQGVTVAVGSADGDRAMLYSPGGFAGTENLPDLGVQYATERTDSGWRSSAIAPPASQFPYIGTYAALDWTRDSSRSLWFANLKSDQGTTRFTPIVRDPDGSFHVAGPSQQVDPIVAGAQGPVGTSEDLLTVVQSPAATRPPLTDGTTDNRNVGLRSLYASTYVPGSGLAVRQVAYRAGVTMFPSCGMQVGGVDSVGGTRTARNSVSRDGATIIFTATCSDPDAQRVWAKVGDADPIDLSASQCLAVCGPNEVTAFQGASRDGSRVYFTTGQHLVPTDEDTSFGTDLYEYDFARASGSELKLITGGPDPDGADVRSVLRVSDDGAYVYFTASGRPLAGQNARGDSPQAGQDNLYVYHRGEGVETTTFIGTLGMNSSPYPQTSTSGRYLLFRTSADLTDEKLPGDGFADLYRYDAQDDVLLRVWSNDADHNGDERVDTAFMQDLVESADPVPSGGMQVSAGWNPRLQISEDGSKVGFSTAEPLSRDDHNNRTDAYLWDATSGEIIMLTDGTSAPGNSINGSKFAGMTPSGDSLFVISASPLLGEHTSKQNAAYVIRRGGGFVPPEPEEGPCPGDSCQPPSPELPPLAGPPGSSTLRGAGNALTTPVRSETVRVGRSRSVRGTGLRLPVKVSSKGLIRVSGRNLARTSITAGKGGSFKVGVRLSQRGKLLLRQKGRVKTRATISFVPTSGRTVKARVQVVFTAKAARATSRATREPSILPSDIQKGR